MVQNPWFYDILVFKHVTRNEMLIQAEIALKNGMIYIFKDEFKYVIETEGLDDGSTVMCYGYCHAG